MTTRSESSRESATIIVHPSAARADALTVQDAMRQVLDFFEIMTPEDQTGGGLVWTLAMASANSPLTVIGEAASLDPSLDISILARLQKQAVAEQLRSLAAGARPNRAISKRDQSIYRRFMQRIINGVGETDAILDGPGSAISMTPDFAAAAIDVLVREERAFDALLLEDREREEIGSIEGYLLQVGSEYNQPAILVRERKTGAEVWCRVDVALKEEISAKIGFEDVWDRRRVIVRGRISYNKQGAILRIRAISVAAVSPRRMTLQDIADANFTGGLTAAGYLERLREGDIGGKA